MLSIMPVATNHSNSFKGRKIPPELIKPFSKEEVSQLAAAMSKSIPKDIIEHAIGHGMKQMYKTPEEIIPIIFRKLCEGKFDYLRGFFAAFKNEPDKDEEIAKIESFLKNCSFLDQGFNIKKSVKPKKQCFRERLKQAFQIIIGKDNVTICNDK